MGAEFSVGAVSGLILPLVGERKSVNVYLSHLSNAKQNFLKLKLVMYIKMVRNTSDYIIKNFCLYFSMNISGWNSSGKWIHLAHFYMIPC